MKLSDLNFAGLIPFVIELRNTALPVLPENSMVELSYLQQKKNYTYLLNRKYLVHVSPKDSVRLNEMLDVAAPRKYFFTVDHCEDNKMYIRPYFVNIYHAFDKELNIFCQPELFAGLPEAELQKKYLCEDRYFEHPTLFILQHSGNGKNDINNYKLISGSQELRVKEINGRWEIDSKKETNCKGIYASWNLCCVSAPHICFKGNNVPGSSNEFNQTMNSLKQVMKHTVDFTGLWNEYEEMEKILLAKRAEEFGKIEYNSCKIERRIDGTIKFIFHLTTSYKNTNKNKFSLAVWDGQTDPKEQGALKSVGTLQVARRGGENTLVTIADKYTDKIEDHGFLVMDIKGDENIHKRRARAKAELLRGETPISNLLQIINEAGQYSGQEEEPPVHVLGVSAEITQTLIKKHKQIRKFNPQQLRALDIALHTSDIAVIKGPPGTGKTFVIREIVECFKDKFSAKENQRAKDDENYVVQPAEMLMSSFQNTAVDNAVKVEDVYAFPAWRVTSKSRPSEKYSKNIRDWAEKCKKNLQQQLLDPAYRQYSEKLQELHENYQSFCNNGKNLPEGKNILKKYLDTFKEYIPTGLQYQIENLCKEETTRLCGGVEGSLPGLLQAQPLSVAAFQDGGIKRIKMLYAFGLQELPEEVRNNLEKLLHTPAESQEFTTVFETYVNHIQTLKNRYCPPEKTHTEKINEIVSVLKALPAQIKQNMQQRFYTQEDKTRATTFIAAEYLQRFEKEYKTLIKKYSNVIGATCQKVGCFELKEKEYDLVIIDEAARAIPLDLFIPIVKAKKIILVGDHAQLTHMLSHETVCELQKDLSLKSKLELLEISLFEKLYTYLLQKGKAVELKYQYRYNDEICRFVSKHFYAGRLETGETIDKEKITPRSGLYENKPLVSVDIDFQKGKEKREKGSGSLHRPEEVKQILADLRTLVNRCPQSTVGIITFYSDQSNKLQEAVKREFNKEELENIFVGTVDSFQGEEYDYILLSCVRSNRNRKTDPVTGETLSVAEPEVGFLNIPNRLCVAFSRAHRQLIAYGDKSTVTKIECFKDLYDHYEQQPTGGQEEAQNG